MSDLRLYVLTAYNSPTIYAYGSREQAERYAEYLDGERTHNLYQVEEPEEEDIEYVAAHPEAVVDLQAVLDLIREGLDALPGAAQQVYGGWIWITDGGVEHAWSKRSTRTGCEAIVLAVTARLGDHVLREHDSLDVEDAS